MTNSSSVLSSVTVSDVSATGKRGRWTADPNAILASFKDVQRIAGLDSLIYTDSVNPWHGLGHKIEGMNVDDVRELLSAKMTHVPVFAFGNKATEIAYQNDDLISDLFTAQRNGDFEAFGRAMNSLIRESGMMLPFVEKTEEMTAAPSLVNPNGRFRTISQKSVDKRTEACDVTRAVMVTGAEGDESIIATVGGTHALFNGSDMCDALENLAIASGGCYKPLTAGTQKGKRLAFISGFIQGLAEMPLDIDRAVHYLNMVQGFDGKRSLMYGRSMTTIVCQNTLSHSIAELSKQGQKFKNSGNIKARVNASILDAARKELDNAVESAKVIATLSERMLNETVSASTALRYLTQYVFGIEGVEKQIEREKQGKAMPADAESRLNAAWLCWTMSPGQDARGVTKDGHGNLWALLNATTAFERHVRPKQDAFETTFAEGNGANPVEFVNVLRNDFPSVFSF